MFLAKVDSRIVRQADPSQRRVWYQSVAAEVLLQHDLKTGDLVSFEIDWDSARGRSYVTWGRGVGVRTGAVDTGEDGGALRHKGSPLVIWDFRNRPERVEEARRLVAEAGLDEGHRLSVLARLQP